MLDTLNSPAVKPVSAPPATQQKANGAPADDEFGSHLRNDRSQANGDEKIKSTDEAENDGVDSAENENAQVAKPTSERPLNIPISLAAVFKKVSENSGDEPDKAKDDGDVDLTLEADVDESEHHTTTLVRALVDSGGSKSTSMQADLGEPDSQTQNAVAPNMADGKPAMGTKTEAVGETKPTVDVRTSDQIKVPVQEKAEIKIDVSQLQDSNTDNLNQVRNLSGDGKLELNLSPPGKTLIDAVRENSNWTRTLSSSAVTQTNISKPDGTVLQTLKVQLNPMDLGKIDLSLRLVQGKMQIDVRTETMDAYRSLSVDQAGLADTLRGLGLKVDSMTVSGPQQTDNTSAQQGFKEQADQRTKEGMLNNGEKQQDGQPDRDALGETISGAEIGDDGGIVDASNII